MGPHMCSLRCTPSGATSRHALRCRDVIPCPPAVSIERSAGLTPRAGTGLHLGGACYPKLSNGKVCCGVGLAIFVHIACLWYFLLTLCSVQTYNLVSLSILGTLIYNVIAI